MRTKHGLIKFRSLTTYPATQPLGPMTCNATCQLRNQQSRYYSKVHLPAVAMISSLSVNLVRLGRTKWKDFLSASGAAEPSSVDPLSH